MNKLLLSCALAAFAGTLTVEALDVNGGSVATNAWMKNIPGTTFASQISIPGTHDSATAEGWSFTSSLTGAARYSTCQEKKIDEQLAAGVRGFDIRPGLSGSTWYCNHGIHQTNLKLADCFNKFRTFLTNNPSEFIVIHIFHGGSGDWSNSNKNSFRTFLSGYSDILANFRRDATVDDLRGKILIFSREDYCVDSSGNAAGDPYGSIMKPFRNDYGWGSWIDWERSTNIQAVGKRDSHLNVGHVFYQDLAAVEKEENNADKKAGIEQLYNFTSNFNPETGESCVWSFNFLSAYTGSTSTSDGYKANSAVTAPVLMDCMNNNPGPAGVVLADYVLTSTTTYNGVELVDAIIKNNFEYLAWTENGVGASTITNPSTTAAAPTTWTFDPNSTTFQGTQASAGIIADFNKDGYMDIMATGSANFAHLYVGGDAWGRYDYYWTDDFARLQYPNLMTLDFDNDGMVDIIASGNGEAEGEGNTFAACGIPYDYYTNSDGGTSVRGTALYRNLGNNEFAAVQNSGIPNIISVMPGNRTGIACQPRPFAVGDFNHDGFSDVVITGYIIGNDGNLQEHAALYTNNGDGTFEMTVDFKALFNSPFSNAWVADFNNDGWLDVVFAGNTCDGNFFINDQEGSFVSEVHKDNLKMYFARATGATVGDFNKDGYLDFYMVGYSDYTGWANLIWYSAGGFGDNVFATPFDFNRFGGNGLAIDWVENLRIDAYDFNYDGNLDIIFDGKEDNRVYYGSEAMTFAWSDGIGCRGGDAVDSATAFGDINGDGTVDRHQTGWHWYNDEIGAARHGMGGNGWNWENSFYTNGGTAPVYPQPTNVQADHNNGQLTVTWTDIDDKTVGYNVVLHNEETGEVIANLPVNTDDSLGNPLLITDGKEAAIRPGVQKYVIDIPWDKFGESIKTRATIKKPKFRVGVQTVGIQYSENVSPINWVAADNVTGIEDITAENNVKVTVAGDDVTVIADEDCEVRIIDMMGRTVATGVANAPIRVAASGVFVVVTPSATTKISK